MVNTQPAPILSRELQSIRNGVRTIELIVEVRPPGAASFRTQMVYKGWRFDLDDFRVGAQLPVLFHPGDPSRTLIDFPALQRAREVVAGEERAARGAAQT